MGRTEGEMGSVVFDFKVRLNVRNAELETFSIQSRRRSGDVITPPVLPGFCIYLAINFMQGVKPKNESPVTGKWVVLMPSSSPFDTITCQENKPFFHVGVARFLDSLMDLLDFLKAPWARSESWFVNCCTYGILASSLRILVQLLYHGMPRAIRCWGSEQEW